MQLHLKKYIKEIVYGANDGVVTTFAVIAGVAGADLSTSIVLIIGFANIFADGFSMAASDYLGTKSECEAKEGTVAECEPAHIWRSAWYTFWAFAVAGVVPLIPYLLGMSVTGAWRLSVATTVVGLFLVGAMRSHYTKKHFVTSGLEVLLVGGAAAVIAYFVGAFLKGLIG
ncbi:MAG TPA: VIT1/CCC1 transporter family protein [Candidatus Paceibacterota bacterium]